MVYTSECVGMCACSTESMGVWPGVRAATGADNDDNDIDATAIGEVIAVRFGGREPVLILMSLVEIASNSPRLRSGGYVATLRRGHFTSAATSI